MRLECAVLALCAVGVIVSAAPGDRALPSDDCTAEGAWWTCLRSAVDEAVAGSDAIRIVDGVSIVKTKNETSRSATGILDRIDSFFTTHAIKFDLSDLDVADGLRSLGRAMSDDDVGEGRGKGKNKIKKIGKMKNMLLPLLLGVKAKFGLLAAIMGNTIAMIAGKAIVISKIALILGFFLFLKKLAHNPPKEIQHERIKHKKIIVKVQEPEHHHFERIPMKDEGGWHGDAGDGGLGGYGGGDAAAYGSYGGAGGYAGGGGGYGSGSSGSSSSSSSDDSGWHSKLGWDAQSLAYRGHLASSIPLQ